MWTYGLIDRGPACSAECVIDGSSYQPSTFDWIRDRPAIQAGPYSCLLRTDYFCFVAISDFILKPPPALNFRSVLIRPVYEYRTRLHTIFHFLADSRRPTDHVYLTPAPQAIALRLLAKDQPGSRASTSCAGAVNRCPVQER